MQLKCISSKLPQIITQFFNYSVFYSQVVQITYNDHPILKDIDIKQRSIVYEIILLCYYFYRIF